MDNNITSLCFSGSDFSNFISFVKSMCSKDKSKFSRVANLQVVDGNLVCKAVDDASNYIEYNVELYPTENLIEEPLAVSINDLSALVKCADGDKYTIRKCFNQYEFNIIGNGWLPFKTAEVDDSRFGSSDNGEEIGCINSSKLKSAISSVLGYTQECAYARDKYIRFSKDKMVVTSRLSSATTKGNFADMTIHRDDAASLKSLLKDSSDIKVYRLVDNVERIVFVGPKFKFSIIASDVEGNNVSWIDDIQGYVSVDCNELYKLVTISEEYSVSKHIVGLSIKDGKLNISIKNILAAKHSSMVNSTTIGDVKDTSNEADIPAHGLLKALKLFQDKHSRNVNIYLTDSTIEEQNCIVVFDDETQAVVNIYNR